MKVGYCWFLLALSDPKVPMDSRKRKRAVPQSPIKLFATESDVQGKVHRDQCWTLREMLGLDGNKEASMCWIVISNFMVDFQYLIESIPELLSVKSVVFYGVAETSPMLWKQIGDVELQELDPSADPGPTNPTQQKIPYGVHHSKFFLVAYDDNTIRVCIHTSNLRYGDVHLKAQAAYIQDFPLKTSSGTSQFEESLVSYLASYRYTKPIQVDGTETRLLDLVRKFDFSDASGVLIPSTPGYHRLDSTQLRGHLKLRQAVAECADDSNVSSIVCQFSSLGSLSEKYLIELQRSMDARSAKRKDVVNKDPLSLKLVYPTVEEVRASIQGYVGGQSVPGSAKNVEKPFLRRLFHRWSSDSRVSNPLWKGKNIPHIKTYYQTHADPEYLSWFVVASQNLSKAAWGEVQTSSRFGGRRLFIRHWELGVFVSPALLHCSRMKVWTPVIDVDADPDDVVSIPLPYQSNPTPYTANDSPWKVDMRYSLADSFGRHSAMDI